jgi:hypothetical protein
MCHSNELCFEKKPRVGWDIAARELHECGEDRLLIPDFFEDEDFEDLVVIADMI